jgi:peptide/nickel transport system permease protein
VSARDLGDALVLTPVPSDRDVAEPPDEPAAVALLRRLARNPKSAAGGVVLLLLVLVAILCPALARYDPNEVHLTAQLAHPSATYWFGTDELGRDVFSRVLFGSRPSLQAGLFSVVLAAAIGSLLGITGGYVGGWFDTGVTRLIDTLLAFPTIFLAIGIVSILGPGWINGVLAITVVNIPVFARLARAVTLATTTKEYIMAGQALGCSNARIVLTHVFPGCLTPLIVQMAIAAPDAILVEATLSFLGLGSQPPAASWGNMLASAQGYLARSATYALFPGLAITLVVFGLNFFADGLQEAIDPTRR